MERGCRGGGGSSSSTSVLAKLRQSSEDRSRGGSSPSSVLKIGKSMFIGDVGVGASGAGGNALSVVIGDVNRCCWVGCMEKLWNGFIIGG